MRSHLTRIHFPLRRQGSDVIVTGEVARLCFLFRQAFAARHTTPDLVIVLKSVGSDFSSAGAVAELERLQRDAKPDGGKGAPFAISRQSKVPVADWQQPDEHDVQCLTPGKYATIGTTNALGNDVSADTHVQVASMSESGATWTLGDLVDLEHFLIHPAIEISGEQGLSAASAVSTGRFDPQRRRHVLLEWVKTQREHHTAALTPGQLLERGESLLGNVMLIIGVAMGGVLAGAWLGRENDGPENAPLFWAATVGVQLAFLVFVVLGWTFRRQLGFADIWRALYAAAQKCAVWMMGLVRRLPGETRDEIRAAIGRMTLRGEPYEALFVAPGLAMGQRLAIGFNIGLLVAMLALHLPLVDVRFGWQSTYPISPQQMHAALAALSTPWNWALPRAQPTLEDVVKTRYARGQRSDTLPTEAARSWWPFLALSIFFYGLALRWILLCGVQWMQRRRLAAVALDHPDATELLRKLDGPLIQSEGGQSRLPQGPAEFAPSPIDGAWFALVACEVKLDDVSLVSTIGARLRSPSTGVRRISIDDHVAVVDALFSIPAARNFVVVVPSDRDPILAVALVLREVAKVAGPRGEVLVLLVEGDEERLAIWRRFLQIHRLRVGVEAM